MSRPESEQDGQILREAAQSRGVRRLPVFPGSVILPAPASSAPEAEKLDLRTVFADELAVLADEVRTKAVADGQAAAKRELASAREKLQIELKADFAKSLKEEQQKLADQKAQLLRLAADLEAERIKLAETMIPTVKRLSMSVVLGMLGSHITSRALIGDLAQRAIEQYRLEGVLRIRVSELDYQSVCDGEHDQNFADLFQVDREAEVGSCVIDFGTGLLDAGLETQLNALKAALLNDGGSHVGEA